MTKNKPTSTSSFGVSGRYSHDSSKFYNSSLYDHHQVPKNVKFIENPAPAECINRIYCKSSENMADLPDNSVHLMVTSPPYNVLKEYDEDMPLADYLGLLHRVFSETFKKMATGGRACINVANLGRKPYIPLHSYIIHIMLDIGYLMRGEIIWNKAASAGGSCAWGSWKSAANPVLRDVHEYILVFSKDSFKLPKKDRENTITRDEFLEYTKSVWTFNTVSAKKIGHPAPFPEELPARLIKLYTFKNALVLDPFCGSGTTCIAALKNDRNYVGYDIDRAYVELAEKRLESAKISIQTEQLPLI